MKWIIQDWTGAHKFPGQSFATFLDGWDFLMGQFPDEEDLGDFYVQEVPTR